MGRKKPRLEEGFVMFDVVYQDGTRSSRRRVPAFEVSGDEDEDNARARTLIMDQDRKIAEMSGNERGPIASISRSAA
jgi:hypothetical protein